MKSKTSFGSQRRPERIALGVLLAAGLLHAQSGGSAFEVATIHPGVSMETMARTAQGGKLHAGMFTGPSRVEIAWMTVADLVSLAYGVSPYEIAGPPDIKVARWDIMAKLPEGANKDQVPAMLQTLLADRFAFKMHRESREQNVYVLVATKELESGGAAIAAVDENAKELGSTLSARMQADADNRTATLSGGPLGTVRFTALERSGDVVRVEMRIGMRALCSAAAYVIDKQVVDATGLNGDYNVRLDMTGDDAKALLRYAAGVGFIPVPAAGSAGQSIFEALKKIGLRLEAKKTAVSMVVVDSVSKAPTEN